MICVISSRSWENSLKPRTAHRWPRNQRLQFLWRRADSRQITCQLESEPSQHRDSIPPARTQLLPINRCWEQRRIRGRTRRFRRGLGIAPQSSPKIEDGREVRKIRSAQRESIRLLTGQL